jgi:hypothetical protein
MSYHDRMDWPEGVEPVGELQSPDHAYMVVAASLVAAIASNRAGSFGSPNAVWDAYVRILHRVKSQGTEPLPLAQGESLL